MSHGFYIYMSYGVSAVVILFMICRIWLDGRACQRELAALDAAGIRRRSVRPSGGADA
ncbi:MAG: heme exporter protein CcmD [Allorhizobium sp.]